MRRRTKLNKRISHDPSASPEIEKIEKLLSLSHQDERFHDESRAVAKIKVDPVSVCLYVVATDICHKS